MGVHRHVNLASYALGNVLKYRVRSTAVIVALILSITLLCSVQFIHDGVVQDVTCSMEEGPDIILQRLGGGRQVPLPVSWCDNISRTRGVRMATPRVWGYIDVGSGYLFTVMGINASDYGSAFGAVGTDIIGDGRFLSSNDTRKIVIGQGIVDMMAASAASVQIHVGSKLSLIAYDDQLVEFEVVGVFSSKSKIFSYDLIITDMDSARRLLGVENGTCTDIAVWIEPGRDLNSVAFRLDNAMPEARVLTRDALRDIALQTYGGRAGIIDLLWVVLIMTVVMLAFTVSSAGSDEARREVGLLKALGFDTVDVLEIRMFESMVLSLLGASLGVSIAIVYDFVLGAPLLAGYLLGWNLVLLNGGIPLLITPSALFMVYAVAIVPVLVATVVPAWKNAITEPDIVLRGV